MMLCKSLILLQIGIACVGTEVDSNQRLSSQLSIILWLNNSVTISYVNSYAHVAVSAMSRTHQVILLHLPSNHPHLLCCTMSTSPLTDQQQISAHEQLFFLSWRWRHHCLHLGNSIPSGTFSSDLDALTCLWLTLRVNNESILSQK